CPESAASPRGRRANFASVLERSPPGSLKCNEPLGGRMTAQSVASVSKPQSSTVAASTGRTQGDAIIQVQDLAKIFDPDILAVDGISFSFRRVEFVGFLGPNGAGKTTTTKEITTLIKMTSGSAIVDGISVDKNASSICK